MGKVIDIRMETDQEQLKRDRKATTASGDLTVRSVETLKAETPSLTEARFVETVAVVAAVTVAWIAKRIVDDWLKSREQGVLIDLRTAPPTISAVANIPRGYVVRIDKDGTATEKRVDYEKQEDLLGWLKLALENA